MFSEKATKIDEIFTVDLTLCSKCQIDGEDFVDFCGLLRKQELYLFKTGRNLHCTHIVLPTSLCTQTKGTNISIGKTRKVTPFFAENKIKINMGPVGLNVLSIFLLWNSLPLDFV